MTQKLRKILWMVTRVAVFVLTAGPRISFR